MKNSNDIQISIKTESSLKLENNSAKKKASVAECTTDNIADFISPKIIFFLLVFKMLFSFLLSTLYILYDQQIGGKSIPQ